MTISLERAAGRVAERVRRGAGADIERLREDAGISRTALARSSGVDDSYLGRIERGVGRPSLETYARLAAALGADLSVRLYPNTGPAIRDRHQAGIVEALLSIVHPKWQVYPEIAVRTPARGWIDLGLHDARAGLFVAVEVQSELRRLEQLLRWAANKAASIPSWEGFAHLGTAPEISRLLVIRETRATRSVVSEFRRQIRAAHPGDGSDALASLSTPSAWPGPSVLWARGRGTTAEPWRILTLG
jgi:transcriptional regulator with XRE-family HTH domain